MATDDFYKPSDIKSESKLEIVVVAYVNNIWFVFEEIFGSVSRISFESYYLTEATNETSYEGFLIVHLNVFENSARQFSGTTVSESNF